jgi:hypothetical protein
MNILYIGSYRTNDDSGEMSRLYLQDIASKHNVTARPVFISDKIIKDIDPGIKDLENNLFSEYDYCIQSLPMEMLTFCGSIKKHIALISNNYLNAINNYAAINQLNRMDVVAVNNTEDEAMLVRSGISCQIKKIDCPINLDMAKSIDKKFNFGIHNDHHKFYLFADCKQDLEVIHKTILAFYMAFRCREGYSLIMVLEGSDQDRENLNKARSDLKKQIEITEYNHSINELYIFDQLSDNDKLMIHNSCDTFLNLSPTAPLLQKQYALFFGNTVIDKTNTNTIELPHRSSYGNTIYYPGNFIESPVTSSISGAMVNCSTKKKKTPTITNTYNHKLSSIIS